MLDDPAFLLGNDGNDLLYFLSRLERQIPDQSPEPELDPKEPPYLEFSEDELWETDESEDEP